MKIADIQQLVAASSVMVYVKHALEKKALIVVLVMMEDISMLVNAINVIEHAKLALGR